MNPFKEFGKAFLIILFIAFYIRIFIEMPVFAVAIAAFIYVAYKQNHSNETASNKKLQIRAYQSGDKYPYKKKNLLTKTEYEFYRDLKVECYKRELLIFPKVRMEDYIDVTTTKEKQKYRGYIKSRHIDFILCDFWLNVQAGIELDDYSHNTAKAKKTDELKNNVFQSIEVPLIRIKVSNAGYTEQINLALDSINLKSPIQHAKPQEPVQPAPEQPAEPTTENIITETTPV